MSRFCSFHKTLCQENCLKKYGLIELVNEDKQEIITRDVEAAQSEKFNHERSEIKSIINPKNNNNTEKFPSSFHNNLNRYCLKEKSKYGSVRESCQSVPPNNIKPHDNASVGSPSAGGHICNTKYSVKPDNTGVTENQIKQLTRSHCHQIIRNRLNLHKNSSIETIPHKTFPTCPTSSIATTSFTSMTDIIQSNLPSPIHSLCSNCTKEEIGLQISIASKISPNKPSLVNHDSCVSGKCPLEQGNDVSYSLNLLKKKPTKYLKQESFNNSFSALEDVPSPMTSPKETSVSSSQGTADAVLLKNSNSSSISDPFWKYVEEKMEFLNELYTKIQDLTTSESLLQAHDIYVRLLDEINNILTVGSLYALCLILPKIYFKKKKSELTYRENIGLPSELQLLIHSHNRKKGVHTYQPDMCSMLIDKHVFSYKICENFLKKTSSTEKKTFRHGAFEDKSIDTTEESENFTDTLLNNLWNLETQNHSTFQILKEPVLLCPLKSQALDCLEFVPFSSQGTKKFSFHHNHNEVPYLSVLHTGEDLSMFESKEERPFMSRQLWLIGEMPAILYAFCDSDKEKKLSKEKKLPAFGCSQTISNSSMSHEGDTAQKNYHKKELELPVEVQIIFLSSFIQSKNTHTEKLNGENKESVSAPSCASLNISCLREKDAVIHFYSFLKNMVNNPHFHRLRVQYYQSKKALSIIGSFTKNAKNKSWNSITTKDYSVTWHLTSTGNVICMLDGVLRSPLFQCLSIINETDLHGNWLPFISESVKLHQVSMFTQVIRQKAKFPWPLQDRDAVLLGCAIDGFQLGTPHIIMYGESVPERATSLFNCPLPLPSKETTRMHIDLFTFILKPDASDPYVANAKLLVLLDSKLLFVPKTLQSFIARTAATKVFINMQRICTSFEQSIYASRVASNKEVYDIIRLRLLNYYSLNLNKS